MAVQWYLKMLRKELTTTVLLLKAIKAKESCSLEFDQQHHCKNNLFKFILIHLYCWNSTKEMGLALVTLKLIIFDEKLKNLKSYEIVSDLLKYVKINHYFLIPHLLIFLSLIIMFSYRTFTLSYQGVFSKPNFLLMLGKFVLDK